MKIVVCIKQVPESMEVKINPETNALVREGVASQVNPFDMYAIEEALRLREAHGGSITVVTMGPGQATEALRTAIEMGVDEAILVSDRAFGGSDTLATSYTLAKTVKKIGEVDLVLCGKQAIDGDTAQVGPEMAERLGWVFTTNIRKIEEVTTNYFVVERMTEDGYERVKVQRPLILTVVKEINEPRLPSLRGKMRAKKYEIPTWKAEDIGADPTKIGFAGSPTLVKKVFVPQQKVEGEIFEGTAGEQVTALVSRMLDGNLIVRGA